MKAVLALCATALFCNSCVSESRHRGMTEQELIPQSATSRGITDSYERRILVSVGIDNYRNADRLRHAVEDARAIVAQFRSLGFEAVELYDESATRAKIVDTVESTVHGAGSNDLVVFFFAGHGTDVKGSDGSTKGYLVPVDGRMTHPGDLVPLNWLQVDLIADSRAKAKHLLFVLDACSSGILAARASVTVDPSVRNYISELMKRQAREVITAGTGDQQVLDGGYKGHSIFAGLVLQGIEENLADLNNDYHITATELGLFLSQRVYIQSKGAQKPDFAKLLGTQGGEVILKFPDDREKQIIAERNKGGQATESDLLLTIRPVAADVSVYDMQNKLVTERKKVNGRVTIPKLPAGDYQVVIRSRDSTYDSVKVILGVYGPVAKDVTLPRQMQRMTPIQLL